MDGHCGYLVFICINYLYIRLFDADLHLLEFSRDTRKIRSSSFEVFRQPVLEDIKLSAVTFSRFQSRFDACLTVDELDYVIDIRNH
jgi:hypothetical protein